MENKLWGDKEIFAIEVGNYNSNTKKGKLRLWLSNEQFGDFKKTFRLSYAIIAFKKLLEVEMELFDNDFENKSEEEIFIHCLLLDKKIENFTQGDYMKAEKLQKFTFYFGDQLDNVANIIYSKNGLFHFIWSMNNDYSGKSINYLKNLKSAKVPSVFFRSVTTSFLSEFEILN